ncbi:hypothetical protein DH2020_026022 [Rehmannia glutinosa]|uniref:Pentatricopeptide repeat-containing protein n=1 Tax=Rehmannia glutinosa TaxID=99300 RepID=A0ABR0W2F2_REHGL
MGVRDSVSWNVMIRCYLENEKVENARELFDRMPERTSVSWNTMIMGYIKAGKTHLALKLFVVMPDKDVVSWTAMVTGLCQASQVDEAWRLFKQMPEPNAVSWSSMVSGFQQHGFSNESLHAFREMLLPGNKPTSHLFTSVLSACADLAMVSISEQVYCQILKRGFHRNTHVGNSAISMFVKTGSFHHARLVFLNLDKPDRVTWNAMITGFAQHGYGQEAMMIFHQMQKAQFSPDGISYMGVLHGCSHCGLVQEGKQYFQSMKTDYGIPPGVEHFSAMVDIYARAGMLKEAYKVILDVPFEPTAIFWRTLLNGCRIRGDVELGVSAAEQNWKKNKINDIYIAFPSKTKNLETSFSLKKALLDAVARKTKIGENPANPEPSHRGKISRISPKSTRTSPIQLESSPLSPKPTLSCPKLTKFARRIAASCSLLAAVDGIYKSRKKKRNWGMGDGNLASPITESD